MGKGLPQRLRQLRKSQHVSQRTLSELCGLSRNAVARYESGERTPTILTLATLADFLGVTVDDLAGRAKSPGACDFSERSVRAGGEAAE